MEASRANLTARLRAKPFAVWVVFACLVYVGLALIPVSVQFVQGASLVVVVPFIIIPIVAAVVALKGKRWSFAVSAAVSVFFLLLFGLFAPGILANPADPSFWFAVSVLSALALGAVFSIAAAVAKGGIEGKPSLASPKSSGGLFTFLVIGFVIGAVVTGTLAAGVVTRLLADTGPAADVVIVPGAVGASDPYAPRTFTVSHDVAVIWYNQDTTQHTVTGTGGAQFDSGLLDVGARWSHAFAQPGNYPYYCTLHPQMTGTVVVT